MVKAAREVMRRMGFVGALALALILAMPAFESQACAADPQPPQDGVTLSVASTPDPGETCPDCGPACAGACCHAPHLAIAPEPSERAAPVIVRTVVWAPPPHAAAVRLSGPDRPPRL